MPSAVARPERSRSRHAQTGPSAARTGPANGAGSRPRSPPTASAAAIAGAARWSYGPSPGSALLAAPAACGRNSVPATSSRSARVGRAGRGSRAARRWVDSSLAASSQPPSGARRRRTPDDLGPTRPAPYSSPCGASAALRACRVEGVVQSTLEGQRLRRLVLQAVPQRLALGQPCAHRLARKQPALAPGRSTSGRTRASAAGSCTAAGRPRGGHRRCGSCAGPRR